jgi:hypothetical protein
MRIQRSNSSLIAIVIGLTLITFGFQNCTKAKFTIDETARQKALGEGNVFDHGDDGAVPGISAGDDGGIPKSPTSGNDPSQPKISMDVQLTCPLTSAHRVNKIFADAGEVKVVFVKLDYTKSPVQQSLLCEVHNVKQQIMQKRKIDLSSCASALSDRSKIVNFFVVEETVTSDYKNLKFNDEPVSYSPGMDSNIIYADMNDKKNEAVCDMVGDPLLVQLNTKTPQPIELSAPDQGVMFDLLGRRANHEKVSTSWLVDANTGNYFLVLPNEDGQVNGIDELFGDATFGPDKRFSKQGFHALAKHDDNKDRVMSSDDQVFSQLRLWKDENIDGIAQAGELSTLDEKGVVAIDLRFDKRYVEKDQHGNMTKFKSVVLMKDDSYGLIYDLWLKYIIR